MAIIPAEPQPANTEAQKSGEARAEDIAYTINHAISCATTDMLIAPTISALFGVNVGCADPAHDHDHHGHHDHAHDHAPAKQSLNWKLYRNEAMHYFKGEIIGDAAAVPITIAIQRSFPQFMNVIRRMIEPLAAPFFRRGANRAAQHWGQQRGFASDAKEVVDRAEMMYQHELAHLPQAVVWNLVAFPIGVMAQKWGGHGTPVTRIVRNKAIGSLISNGMLIGGRALAPDAAESFDRADSRYVITPISNAVGAVFGVHAPSWQKRLDQNRVDVSPPHGIVGP